MSEDSLLEQITAAAEERQLPNGREAWRGWVIIANRLRQPRFHANFGRIFEHPKFRPCFHA